MNRRFLGDDEVSVGWQLRAAELGFRELPLPLPPARQACLYAPADIDALTPEQVRPVIEERVAWLDRSLSLDEAAESLGWHYRELNQVISDRGIEVRLRRIARADVDVLVGDEELRADRLVTASSTGGDQYVRDRAGPVDRTR